MNTNDTKATYITPHISNLIHQTEKDEITSRNTPSLTYNSYYFDDYEKTDLSMVPVQGDDPPQRLIRVPSRNRTLKEIYPNGYLQEKTACPPYSPTTSSSSSISSYESEIQQTTTVVQDNPPPPPLDTTTKSDKQSPFSCLVVFDALEHTASNTRRGRPPVTEEYNPDSQLRFVKPTICSVHMSKRKKPELQSPSLSLSSSSTETSFMVSYDNGDMPAGFDNPNKKRGRKPKSQIQGNSFFVLRNS